MRKGKKMTGKSWKRIVRILSCIVVFCTTYALILPAITLEAQSYCGQQEHTHNADCYKEILSCTKEEHVHDESCYDEEGSLICTTEEHTHDQSCYREVLDCGLEEHEHSLECFSNPDADIETEAEWKDTLPDEKDGQTVRERIVAIAKSQKGYKESEDNYVVDNETDKRGITRYGQWDNDDYENWDSAFVRFVLHYSDAETTTTKKQTGDWMRELSDAKQLQPTDKAEPGDVIFAYDDKDEAKAGIVLKADTSTITAMMGDWADEVMEKSFPAGSNHLHSIWKPVEGTIDSGTEEEIPVIDEEKEEKEEEKETEKEEEITPEETVVTYDYTKEVNTEDGATIRVSWNEGTFETEDVTFQAKKVDLTEEEMKKVQDQLDKDKNYSFRNYDLTFYVRDSELQLQKVEPKLPVHVEIMVEGGTPEEDNSLPVFHFQENGEIEVLERKKQTGKESQVSFDANSFTVYAVPTSGEPSAQAAGQNITSVWDINQKYGSGETSFYLNGNVGKDNGADKKNKYVYLNKENEVTIDLKGHAWQIKGTILVTDGTKLRITNSASVSTQDNSVSNAWDQSGPNSTSRIKYADKEGNMKMAVAGGLIVSDEATIKVEGAGSSVILENGVGIISNGHEGIMANDAAQVTLNHSYICSNVTGVGVHFGSKLTINDGAVISLNNNSGGRGGGVYADDLKYGENPGDNNKWYGSQVTMNGGLISSNTAQSGGGFNIGRVNAFGSGQGPTTQDNFARSCLFTMNGGVIAGNKSTTWEGGGLALQFQSYSRAVIYNGEFYKNEANSGKDWGGGGIFISEYNYLWMPNGASIYDNTSVGLGGGLTGCSTGKMIVDPSLRVFQNEAQGSNEGFPETTEKNKAYKYRDHEPGYYGTEDGYKGEDIFGAEITQVSGQFDNSGTLINANWQGNVDKTFTVDNDGTTLNAGDWLAVKCMLPDAETDPLKNVGLQIHGNTSKNHGGGVLVNGWLVTGNQFTNYLGKSFGLKGFKQLLDESGKPITMTAGQFHFKVTEIDDQNAPAIITGTNNENGNIVFNGKLPVGDQEQTKYTFYLMEDLEQMPSGYTGSTDVYQIDVEVRNKETTTFYMQTWDKSKQAYVATKIDIVTREISKITYNKLPDGTTNTSGNNEKLTIGSQNDPTFINKVTKKTSIRVKKKWADGKEAHVADSVKVNLLRNDQVFKTATLSQSNDWTYTWTGLPVAEGATSYTYTVSEDTPSGYISSVSQTDQFGAEPGETKSVYGPATSIEGSKQYLIIDSVNHKGMTNNGTSMGMIDVSGYKVDGVNAYKPDVANTDIAKLESNTEYELSINDSRPKINALQFGNTSHYLAASSTSPGLCILNHSVDPKYYDSADRGFCINAADLVLQTDTKVDGDQHKKLVSNGSQFGTEDYISSANGKVQLFELGTVTIGGTSAGVEYTITNTPISNQLTVIKTDSADADKKLAGAKFKLYKDKECTNPVLVSGANGSYQVTGTGSNSEMITGTDGTFVLSGLPEGTFYLKETEAPNGYEILSDQVVKVVFDNTTSSKATISISKTVENTLLTYELPETGSTGTRFYTAAGTAMLISSAALYEYNKKRKRKGGV